MNFYKEDTIYDFFDLSIILPFYKKLREFEVILPRNLKYFQRNGIELIIVLDTPEEEKELIKFLNTFPFLNYQVVINRVRHEWRNPAKALNVGIKHASRKYILVVSPETEFLTDIVYQLRYILNSHHKSFAVGQVCFLGLDNLLEPENIHKFELLPYGSIMVEKRYLEEVRGYSEELTTWGGDDNNVRARLELLGLQKLLVTQAIAIHREEKSDGHKSRYKKNANMVVDTYKAIFYPQEIVINKRSWGTDFNEVAYTWTLRNNKKDQCEKYLQAFQKYWIKNDDIFNTSFKIIALIQTKNEIKHLPEVLTHLDKYCDGIILLDDDSKDGSYEAAMSEKLLLKVQKKGSDIFDDLGLRNIKLELAAFFNNEWLFFIDADERFDVRYADLYNIANRKEIDSVCFYVVHLWNNEYSYRKDVPEGNDGVLLRYRMFRSYGKLQITSNRLLHFPATPFKQNSLNAPILILHYGNIEAAIRRKKYERYVAQDKQGLTQGYSFEYLLESDVVLEDVNTIQL